MIRVTFSYYSRLLGKWFYNVEEHRTLEDARLRALALNWSIISFEEVRHVDCPF